jgi:hypothetical protein
MTRVKIEVDVSANFFVQWPYIQILLNDKELYNDQIENTQLLKFEVECKKNNNLKFIHYNKFYGDDGIWHSDGKNECWVNINDIKFDDVSIGEHLKSKLLFIANWTNNQKILHDKEFINNYSKLYSNGRMAFNGIIELEFETPVYNWLIPSKYKSAMIKTSYFSGSTQRWHYEEDIKLINEIKQIMKFQ